MRPRARFRTGRGLTGSQRFDGFLDDPHARVVDRLLDLGFLQARLQKGVQLRQHVDLTLDTGELDLALRNLLELRPEARDRGVERRDLVLERLQVVPPDRAELILQLLDPLVHRDHIGVVRRQADEQGRCASDRR